jgi:phage terminase large subunit GpA-like protein
MDALSASSPVERVVFMKGAQEAGLNWVGYVVSNARGLMLYVMPTTESGRRNVRTRIDPDRTHAHCARARQQCAIPRPQKYGNTEVIRRRPDRLRGREQRRRTLVQLFRVLDRDAHISSDLHLS